MIGTARARHGSGRRRRQGLLFGLAALLAIGSMTASADTLGTVRERGQVLCGVSIGLLGFSAPDEQGRWQGLDADFCRAVAAAVLGGAEQVRFVPLDTHVRFDALRRGEVDVLARNSTWTMARDIDGLEFVGVNYFDGQGFLVRKSLGVLSVLEFEDVTICAAAGTTHGAQILDFLSQNQSNASVLRLANHADAARAYEAGRCSAYTADRSSLAARRLSLDRPDDHLVLSDTISKEPLGIDRGLNALWLDGGLMYAPPLR